MEPGSKLVTNPSQHMLLHYRDYLQKKIDFLPAKQILTQCHSRCIASELSVPKKHGKLPLVIDYGQIIRQTNNSTWPLPSMEKT